MVCALSGCPNKPYILPFFILTCDPITVSEFTSIYVLIISYSYILRLHITDDIRLVSKVKVPYYYDPVLAQATTLPQIRKSLRENAYFDSSINQIISKFFKSRHESRHPKYQSDSSLTNSSKFQSISSHQTFSHYFCRLIKCVDADGRTYASWTGLA